MILDIIKWMYQKLQRLRIIEVNVMEKRYVQIVNVLNGNNEIKNNILLIGKTKKTIIVGPYIKNEYEYDNLYKRLLSSCVYNKKTFRKVRKKTINKLNNKIDINNLRLKMLELQKDGNIIEHKIFLIPGGVNEK